MVRISSSDPSVDPKVEGEKQGLKTIIVTPKDGESESDAFVRFESENEGDFLFIWFENVMDEKQDSKGMESKEKEERVENDNPVNIDKVLEETEDNEVVPKNTEISKSVLPDAPVVELDDRLINGQSISLQKWDRKIIIKSAYESILKFHLIPDQEEFGYYEAISQFQIEESANLVEFELHLVELALKIRDHYNYFVMDPGTEIDELIVEGKRLKPGTLGFDIDGFKSKLIVHKDVVDFKKVMKSLLIEDTVSVAEGKTVLVDNLRKLKKVKVVMLPWEYDVLQRFKRINIKKYIPIDDIVPYYSAGDTLSFSLKRIPKDKFSRDKFKILSPPDLSVSDWYFDNNMYVREVGVELVKQMIKETVSFTINENADLAPNLLKMIGADNNKATFDTNIANVVSGVGAKDYMVNFILAKVYGRYLSLDMDIQYETQTIDSIIAAMTLKLMYDFTMFDDNVRIKLNNFIAFQIIPILPGYVSSEFIFDPKKAKFDHIDYLKINSTRRGLFGKMSHPTFWKYVLDDAEDGSGWMATPGRGPTFLGVHDKLVPWISGQRDLLYAYCVGAENKDFRDFTSTQFKRFRTFIASYRNSNSSNNFKFFPSPSLTGSLSQILQSILNKEEFYHFMFSKVDLVLSKLSLSPISFPILPADLKTLEPAIHGQEIRIVQDVRRNSHVSALLMMQDISVAVGKVLFDVLETQSSLAFFFEEFEDYYSIFKKVMPKTHFTKPEVVKKALSFTQDIGFTKILESGIESKDFFSRMAFLDRPGQVSRDLEYLKEHVIKPHASMFGFLTEIFYSGHNVSLDPRIYTQSYVFDGVVDKAYSYEELKNLVEDWKINQVIMDAKKNGKSLEFRAPFKLNNYVEFSSKFVQEFPFLLDPREEFISKGIDVYANFNRNLLSKTVKMDDPRAFLGFEEPMFLMAKKDSVRFVQDKLKLINFIHSDIISNEWFEIFTDFEFVAREKESV
jgi:hypothetical protein